MNLESDIGWVYPAIGHSVNEASRNYGHPAHRGFQQDIEADPILFPDVSVGPLAGTFVRPLVEGWCLEIPEHDIYILENAESVYAIPFIKRSVPDATIILLAAHRVFGLESYDFSSDAAPKSIIRRGERYLDATLIRSFIRNYVDGVIAVSDHVKAKVDQFAPGLPKEAVHPYIQPGMVDDLDDVSPTLDDNHAVVVCESRDHKGVDRLVKAWPTVRARVPDATLHIVGNGHPTEYEETSGVTVRGYVDDLAAEYAQASLYIHPARADAFGVTVVEAMRAGVVPVVTQTTGAYPFVSEVDEHLVVNSDSEAIASGIVQYFQTEATDREALSQKSIEVAEPFTRCVKAREFGAQFNGLLQQIATTNNGASKVSR
jgi:glycosyltransferase involved in cell wall biosynthesis